MWNCFHNLVKNLILVNTLPLQYKCDCCRDKRKIIFKKLGNAHMIYHSCILQKVSSSKLNKRMQKTNHRDKYLPFLQALLIHSSMLTLPSLFKLFRPIHMA